MSEDILRRMSVRYGPRAAAAGLDAGANAPCRRRQCRRRPPPPRARTCTYSRVVVELLLEEQEGGRSSCSSAERVERAAPRRATAAKAISKFAEDSGSDDSDSGSD